MRKFRCPVCRNEYMHPDGLYRHVDGEHGESLQGMSPKQYVFNVRYGYKGRVGQSVISKKPTPWNEKIGKYERFADDAERQQYRQQFLDRMQKAYGKDTLLGDPDVQKRMLAARKISGRYTFKDGKEVTYTGEYERHFLEAMDGVLGWPSSDLFVPAPQVIPYVNPRTGKPSFYIPDAFIESLNMLIEIKATDNKGYRQRDLDIEKAKDAAVVKARYRFAKVTDKRYAPLLDAVIDARNQIASDGGIYDD